LLRIVDRGGGQLAAGGRGGRRVSLRHAQLLLGQYGHDEQNQHQRHEAQDSHGGFRSSDNAGTDRQPWPPIWALCLLPAPCYLMPTPTPHLSLTPAPTHTATWLIHCDGSALPNPGRMGLGAVIVAPDGSRQTLSVDTHSTGCNNEAELRAV